MRKSNLTKIGVRQIAAGLAAAVLLVASPSVAATSIEVPPTISASECEDRLGRCWAEERAMEIQIRECEREVRRCERRSSRCLEKLGECQEELDACEGVEPGPGLEGAMASAGVELRSGLDDILDDIFDLPCHIALEGCVASRTIKQLELLDCESEKQDCLDEIDTCELDLEECEEDLEECGDPAGQPLGRKSRR